MVGAPLGAVAAGAPLGSASVGACVATTLVGAPLGVVAVGAPLGAAAVGAPLGQQRHAHALTQPTTKSVSAATHTTECGALVSTDSFSRVY